MGHLHCGAARAEQAFTFVRKTFLQTAIGLFALLLGAVCATPTAAAPLYCSSTFLTAPFFRCGSAPRAVAMADLNRDGNLDIIVANSGIWPTNASISVLLGRGNGTFERAVDYAGGPRPGALAIADFNGDTHPDIAVGNHVASQQLVSVLLAKPSGGFETPRSSDAGGEGRGVAPADFDGDGKVDLAVANSSWGTVSILRGKGDGTFEAPTSYRHWGGGEAVATGDFNRDNKIDLAVVNTPEDNRGRVSVLLGQGDGTFGNPTHNVAGEWVTGVAAADINADGKLDLVVANTGNAVEDGSLSLLLGNGDGSFQSAVRFTSGSNPSSVAVGDFNGDGRLDLAGANTAGDVAVLSGRGDGTFRSPVSYGVAGTSWGGAFLLAAGDVNNDNRLDLARIGDGTVSLLLSSTSGALRGGVNQSAGMDPMSVLTGDFNGDDFADVAVASHRGPSHYSAPGTVRVLLGTGNAGFVRAGDYVVGHSTRAMAATDFDKNGWPDLVVVSAGGDFDSEPPLASVLLSNRDGTFEVANYNIPYGSRVAAAGDFNRDGNPDVAVASPGRHIVPMVGRDYYINGAVALLLGTGDGRLQAATNLPASLASVPWGLASSDFNRDGILDLALGDSPTNGRAFVSILRGVGDGTFQTQTNYFLGVVPYRLLTGDFNKDGKPDLAAAGGGLGCVAVALGNGDGSFQTHQNYSLGNIGDQFYAVSVSAIAAVDLNNDGNDDLVATTGGGYISALFGNRDGTFQPGIAYAGGALPAGLAAADFNGDQRSDLIVANRAGALLLLNTWIDARDIHVTRDAGGLRISWPAESTGAVLETTPSLISPTWQNTGATPALNGYDLEVTLPTDSPTRFFRLQKP